MSEVIAAATAWRRAYVAAATRFTTPEIVGQWRVMGTAPQEAAAWANLGFLPEEAGRLIDLGVTAERYAEAYEAEVAAHGGPDEHLRQQIVELFTAGMDVAPGVWDRLPGTD